MSLAASLAEIYAEVARFGKSKSVTGSGPSYKYTPVEEIADELRKAMGQRGIVMVPSKTEIFCSEDAGTTKSGTTRWRHIVNMEWTLTDGTDSLTVASVGESMDTGDKGMNKAQTAARKYALIGAFQLSTGDDPDRSHPEMAVHRPTPAILARELIAISGDEKALVSALRDAGIKSVDLADSAVLAEARKIAEGIAKTQPDPPAEVPAPEVTA